MLFCARTCYFYLFIRLLITKQFITYTHILHIIFGGAGCFYFFCSSVVNLFKNSNLKNLPLVLSPICIRTAKGGEERKGWTPVRKRVLVLDVGQWVGRYFLRLFALLALYAAAAATGENSISVQSHAFFVFGRQKQRIPQRFIIYLRKIGSVLDH